MVLNLRYLQAALKDAKQSKGTVDKEIKSLQSEIMVSIRIYPKKKMYFS